MESYVNKLCTSQYKGGKKSRKFLIFAEGGRAFKRSYKSVFKITKDDRFSREIGFKVSNHIVKIKIVNYLDINCAIEIDEETSIRRQEVEIDRWKAESRK